MELIRGRYEVVRSVGRGGQGEVIQALDHQHDRLVALKVRDITSEHERSEILREASVLLSLTPHKCLPLVREDFFDGDRYYVAMDWIEGRTLQELLAEGTGRGLPTEQFVDYLEQLAEALNHLHSHTPPVVHQDVKPANVILTDDDRVVLVDFGIASRSQPRPGSWMGTRGFVAPEIASGGPLTPLADVFGLGALAFALLTGRTPGSDAVQDIRKQLTRGERRALRVIRAALSIDPSRRPSSVSVFMKLLKESLSSRIHYRQGARLAARAAAMILVTAAVVGLLFRTLTAEEGQRAAPPRSSVSPVPTVPKTKASPSPTKSEQHDPSPSPSPSPTPSSTSKTWTTFEHHAFPNLDEGEEPTWAMIDGGQLTLSKSSETPTESFSQEVVWTDMNFPHDDWPTKASSVQVSINFEYWLEIEGNPEETEEEEVFVAAGVQLRGAGCGQDGLRRELHILKAQTGPPRSVPNTLPSIDCALPSNAGPADNLELEVVVVGFYVPSGDTGHERRIHLDFKVNATRIEFKLD